MQRTFDIFVPGRVCLFGEHSDWAGGHRRINSDILPGQVIIAGTNQGLHARTTAHPNTLVIKSTLPDGKKTDECRIPMERDALLREAGSGGFYSYAAGVAYYMMTFYHVKGIEIDNYLTTLPVKKGLSSSAAMCVLVARAFNKVYDLKLTVRAEMEAAYQGEILTPSRCGRMDQGCAYGQVPVVMTFDGDFLRAHQSRVGKPICLLIADLKGSKDTIKILSDLNRAYPFAQDDVSKGVRKYLGEINADIVERAAQALTEGDAESLGKLMTCAQAEFDRYLMPASPDQLTSVKLHSVLADATVARLTYGAKGVGSQGDGCVQFVVRDEHARDELVRHLEKAYGMDCFPLDLKPPQTVRKAVIPAAGFGTRMFPASKAIKKEFFPVVTPDGVAKPIILAIVEEAIEAGVEEIAIVIKEEDRRLFDEFFNAPLTPDHYNRLPENARRYCHTLHEMGERITFLTQDEQEGFGHAVYCAREWVGDEPFLLMLGDHLYMADHGSLPCASQLIDVFERSGRRSTIGVYVADVSEVSHYGTVTGFWADDERRVLDIAEIAEKPSADYARNHLMTEGMTKDTFLCVYGQYVFTPAIFEHLQRVIDEDHRERGEIQMTTAIEDLRKAEGLSGFLVAGRHYDTGLPEPYVHTLSAILANHRPAS